MKVGDISMTGAGKMLSALFQSLLCWMKVGDLSAQMPTTFIHQFQSLLCWMKVGDCRPCMPTTFIHHKFQSLLCWMKVGDCPQFHAVEVGLAVSILVVLDEGRRLDGIDANGVLTELFQSLLCWMKVGDTRHP